MTLDPEKALDMYFEIKAGRVKLASDSSELVKIMKAYVAMLRALYFVHQTSHWKCNGTNFYGNHLLFQRLYEGAADKVDTAAEKLIGLFGNDSLNQEEQYKLLAELTSKYCSENLLENSLQAELDFINLASQASQALKKNNGSLGLDNMIADHIDSAETSVYLLKQAKSE